MIADRAHPARPGAPVGAQTAPVRAARRRRVPLLPYLLVAPAVILMLVIALYPAYYAVQLSLYDVNLARYNRARFVGLDNYWKLLVEDEVFRVSVLQTLRWVGVVILGQLGLALPVALFLNQNFSLRGFLRTVILIPWVIPAAVTSLIWVFMFDANLGVANDILVRLGIIETYWTWLSDFKTAFFLIVMAAVWSGFPFMSIVLLAALQSIPEELYEAAKIDGAGNWRRFWHITLPLLVPTIMLLLLLRTIWLSHNVDLVYIMTVGGPGYSNYTTAVYSFLLTTSQFEIGYASAVAVILAIVLLSISTVYVRQMERTQEYLQ
jgi:multiple sugar transport system permease protein